MTVSLFVGRETSIRAITEAMEDNGVVLLTTQRSADVEEPTGADLHQVGTLGLVKNSIRLPDGTLKVLVECTRRARIDGLVPRTGYLSARPGDLPDTIGDDEDLGTLERELIHVLKEHSRITRRVSWESVLEGLGGEEPGLLADTVAEHLGLPLEGKQEILATADIGRRLRLLTAAIERDTGQTVRSRADVEAEPPVSPATTALLEAEVRRALEAIRARQLRLADAASAGPERSTVIRKLSEQTEVPPSDVEAILTSLTRIVGGTDAPGLSFEELARGIPERAPAPSTTPSSIPLEIEFDEVGLVLYEAVAQTVASAHEALGEVVELPDDRTATRDYRFELALFVLFPMDEVVGDVFGPDSEGVATALREAFRDTVKNMGIQGEDLDQALWKSRIRLEEYATRVKAAARHDFDDLGEIAYRHIAGEIRAGAAESTTARGARALAAYYPQIRSHFEQLAGFLRRTAQRTLPGAERLRPQT